MSDQAAVNRFNGADGRWRTAHVYQDPANHRSGIRSLLADLTELAELQTRLFATDLKATVRRIVAPTILIVVGGAVLLGSMPVALAALSQWLVARFDWSQALALLASGGSGLVLALLIIGGAWLRLRRCTSPLERTMQELSKNVASLRHSLMEKDEHGAEVSDGRVDASRQ